jgi:hypothetical protein
VSKKFTSGEWFTAVDGTKVHAEGRGALAYVSVAQAMGPTKEEAMANAALIPASPTMYATLDEAMIGYRVLKTVLSKAGLNAGAAVAVEHIAEIEAVLKKARSE